MTFAQYTAIIAVVAIWGIINLIAIARLDKKLDKFIAPNASEGREHDNS